MNGSNSVSDPYSFFTDTDPDPEVEAVDQYGSGYGSVSNPDPIRIQGFNDPKLQLTKEAIQHFKT
jgi:hypothetical protein